MTLEAFHANCKGFKPDEGDFAALLQTGLATLGLSTTELGKLLEVAPSTISRWANGHTKPLRRMQLEVVKLLARKVLVQL